MKNIKRKAQSLQQILITMGIIGFIIVVLFAPVGGPLIDKISVQVSKSINENFNSDYSKDSLNFFTTQSVAETCGALSSFISEKISNFNGLHSENNASINNLLDAYGIEYEFNEKSIREFNDLLQSVASEYDSSSDLKVFAEKFNKISSSQMDYNDVADLFKNNSKVIANKPKLLKMYNDLIEDAKKDFKKTLK